MPAKSDLEAAKAAASAESRREAVEQAIERHPEVAERVEQAIAAKAEKAGDRGDDSVPAAPAPDAVVDKKGRSGKSDVAENVRRGVAESAATELRGTPGGGGGSGPSFDVTLLDDSVLVTQAGGSPGRSARTSSSRSWKARRASRSRS